MTFIDDPANCVAKMNQWLYEQPRGEYRFFADSQLEFEVTHDGWAGNPVLSDEIVGLLVLTAKRIKKTVTFKPQIELFLTDEAWEFKNLPWKDMIVVGGTPLYLTEIRIGG